MSEGPKQWARYLIALDIIHSKGIDDSVSYEAAQAIKDDCQRGLHDDHPNADAHLELSVRKFECMGGGQYHGNFHRGQL